eukprot:8129374-Pyramimonas_sp.AAC.1
MNVVRKGYTDLCPFGASEGSSWSRLGASRLGGFLTPSGAVRKSPWPVRDRLGTYPVAPGGFISAVSYTHLRAHETGAYL